MKPFRNCALLLLCLLAISAQAAERPNIVFILADDLGWGELGCYGQEKIRTPNLDRLAEEGMRFTQHYAGAPVCAPSRNVLMTGLHLGHATIRSNRPAQDEQGNRMEGQQPIPSGALTIAEVLQEAGYKTAAMGKWGLGPVGSSGDPHRQGFDWFYGYNCQRVAHSYFPPHLWRNDEKVIINKNPVPGHKRQPNGPVRMDDWIASQYSSDLIEAEAVRFIEESAGDPFFLYLPFIEPHVAMHPPKRLVESYPKEWDERPYRGEHSYLPHPRPHAGYAAMISHLDEHVGKVLDALKRKGIENETIVFFTSDNGTTHIGQDAEFGVGGADPPFFNSTRDLKGYKGSVYEGGLRVPLIVRWPGHVPAGATSDFPSYFPDHFATLCDLLELNPPGERDGISLLPVLTGKGQPPERNPMVWLFAGYGGQLAVRLGDYKVVRQNLSRDQPGTWEVYNLSEDRSETTNLAERRPEILSQAKSVLQAEIDENPLFPMRIPGVTRGK